MLEAIKVQLQGIKYQIDELTKLKLQEVIKKITLSNNLLRKENKRLRKENRKLQRKIK